MIQIHSNYDTQAILDIIDIEASDLKISNTHNMKEKLRFPITTYKMQSSIYHDYPTKKRKKRKKRSKMIKCSKKANRKQKKKK